MHEFMYILYYRPRGLCSAAKEIICCFLHLGLHRKMYFVCRNNMCKRQVITVKTCVSNNTTNTDCDTAGNTDNVSR